MRIIKYPHPTLRYKSKDLRRVDAELRKMVRQMFDAMYEHEGIGLAANQVDLPYRLFIVNLAADPAAKDEEHVFINPVISQPRGMAEDREGCLSFPEIYAPVRRPEKILLSGLHPRGQEVCYELDGLWAGPSSTRRITSTASCSSTGSLPATWRPSRRTWPIWSGSSSPTASMA